jgi:hypothetical protein
MLFLRLRSSSVDESHCPILQMIKYDASPRLRLDNVLSWILLVFIDYKHIKALMMNNGFPKCEGLFLKKCIRVQKPKEKGQNETHKTNMKNLMDEHIRNLCMSTSAQPTFVCYYLLYIGERMFMTQ